MAISVAGIIICGALLLIGRLLGATLIVPLVASLAFGATAIVKLSSLGGSSPLIYTVFVLALMASMMLRRRLIVELERVLSQDRAPLILAVLVIYACVGAFVFPRIFAGEASAFVASRPFGVTEVPLAPTAGNITQTAYFTFGALTFYALSVLLLNRENLDKFRTAFLTFAFLHASLGVIDLAGKMAGAGDVLAPIRSASYALLTDVEEEGFFRIVGGFSEASAYAATTLACLGFTFAYGRINGSRFAMILSLVLFALLILSTSTTAYVSLAIVAVPVVVSTAHATISQRLTKADMGLMVIAWMASIAILAINLYDSHILEPLWTMFDATIFNKATSASGQERSYWNFQSWQSFIDTQGIGLGLGSSRASSWVIAVLSQLGVLGSLAMTALVFELLKGIGRPRQASDVNVVAMHQGVRASAVAGLVAESTSSGSADPGLLFFIALAVVLACRRYIRVESSVVATKAATLRQPARRETASRPDGIVGLIGAKMVGPAVRSEGVKRAEITAALGTRYPDPIQSVSSSTSMSFSMSPLTEEERRNIKARFYWSATSTTNLSTSPRWRRLKARG